MSPTDNARANLCSLGVPATRVNQDTTVKEMSVCRVIVMLLVSLTFAMLRPVNVSARNSSSVSTVTLAPTSISI
jgi:hypothetical protein